jgi:hypothetical protein
MTVGSPVVYPVVYPDPKPDESESPQPNPNPSLTQSNPIQLTLLTPNPALPKILEEPDQKIPWKINHGDIFNYGFKGWILMALIEKNSLTLILLDKNGRGLQSRFDVLKCYVLDGLVGGKMVYVTIHAYFGWDGEKMKGVRMVDAGTLRFEDGGKYDLVRMSREDVRMEF